MQTLLRKEQFSWHSEGNYLLQAHNKSQPLLLLILMMPFSMTVGYQLFNLWNCIIIMAARRKQRSCWLKSHSIDRCETYSTHTWSQSLFSSACFLLCSSGSKMNHYELYYTVCSFLFFQVESRKYYKNKQTSCNVILTMVKEVLIFIVRHYCVINPTDLDLNVHI